MQKISILSQKGSSDEEANRAREELKIYLQHFNISLNKLAKQQKVSQSTLHRFSEGRIKTITKTVRPVIDFVHKSIENMQNQVGLPANPIIREKIWEAAEGSPTTARIIIDVIEAIGPVLAKHPAFSKKYGKE